MSDTLSAAWDECQNMCDTWVYETLGAEIDRLTAEVERLKGYNRKLCEGAESENQRALLAESEVERLKKIAKINVTGDFADYISDLQSKLSRYEAAVEVDGVVQDECGLGGYISVVRVPKEMIGQRVTVLVMKEGDGNE